MIDINLSPYTGEQQAIDRRRRMAEALQQQATTPIEQPTTPGVRVSPYAGLAKILQSYFSVQQMNKADEAQKAYETSSQEDVARLLRNMGKTETVPGDVTSLAQEARYEPPVPIQENLDRKQELVNLIAPAPENAARAAIGYNLMRPEDRERITNLPSMTEGREIPAVAEVRGASRQVPYLSADLLDPNNPNAMKTGTGRMMLAQVLMQQEAQKQAIAQAERAAALQIHTAKPGEIAYRMGANGVPVPFLNTPAQPKWEHTSKFENGQEVTGWVNTNAADIPGSFVRGAVKPEMTESQRLDAQLKQYTADVEAAKSQDVGRKSIQFQPLPKGVPVGAKRTGGKTPDGKDVYELNGKKYVGD